MKPRRQSMSKPSKRYDAHCDELSGPAIPQLAQWNASGEKDRSKNGSIAAHPEIRMDESLNNSWKLDSWLEEIPWPDSSVDTVTVDPFRVDWPHW